MRYGVLSDVHGNLHALQAVVADLREHGVDRWLCTGDVIGYGPFPNECVDLLASLGATVVAGNHELIVLGALPGRSSPRACRSHAWTRDLLRDDVREHLARLPRRTQVDDALVLAHGSLDDAEEYVATPAQADAQLAELARQYPQAHVLLLGHTHRQQVHSDVLGPLALRPATLALAAGHRHLVNAGSVGQSRQWEVLPRAAAAVVDLEARTLVLRRCPYDLAGAVLALRRSGLPYRSLHSPPRLVAGLRRRLRRLSRPSR